ncbi:MAG: DNA polymerase III subunit delta [Gemmatimonadota bacterium]
MTLAADSQLSRLLERGPVAGAWFLHGDALRLKEEAADRIARAALDPATRDFNFDRFHGDSTSAEELAAALAMPPMMADCRVVTVREAQALAPTARKALQEVVENLPSDLVLIVTVTIPRGSSAAFYKTLEAHARSLEWSAPRESEIPGWLMDRARSRHGFELTREAAQAIAAGVGEDLSLLDAELAKLANLGETRVDVERVRALVPSTRRIDRWAWLDRVADREYEAALRELDALLTSDRGVPLVAGLVEQHLFVGIAVQGGTNLVRRALSEAGRGYLSWKANTYARQARRWNAAEIRQALRLLLRADDHLKSGAADRAVLHELLLALRHAGTRAA